MVLFDPDSVNASLSASVGTVLLCKLEEDDLVNAS